MDNQRFMQLKERLLELSYINSTMAMLHWDEQVNMPPQGAVRRSHTQAYLAGLHHLKFLSINDDQLLTKLRAAAETGKLDDEQTAIIKEVGREFDRAKKLPVDFVKEMARITSEAHTIWAAAKAKNDWQHFAPCLKQIVDLKRQEAKYIGYRESPYDVHLDQFEPGVTVKQLEPIFQEIKGFLIQLLTKIQQSTVTTNPNLLYGDYPIEKQVDFNRQVAEKMGFNFRCGCLHNSVHPFTQALNPEDVRITTRYDEHNLLYALLTTIHEVGHALYEQGIASDNFGTPLGETGSYGLHESQSMIWERCVGEGKAFWQHFYPQLQALFPEPLAKISLDDYYRTVNHVQPSFIRTEADEVTYILHIIMRFEIERDLIEGRLDVDELPTVWQQKMKDYLGLQVPNDALGVLQDVHWASGYFGYFPAYALGTLYAIQLFEAAKRAMPNLEAELAAGRCAAFREWLRQNIHVHGKRYSVPALLKQATGEELNPRHFMEYIERKYQEIYQLSSPPVT